MEAAAIQGGDMTGRNKRRRTAFTATGKTRRRSLSPVTANRVLPLVIAVLLCLTFTLAVWPAPRVSASGVCSGGSIFGQVTESGTSPKKPVNNVIVYVYDADDPSSPVTHAVTWLIGIYRLGGLSTGDYKVLFSGDVAHFPQWYGDKASFDEADVIHVEAPGTAWGISASLDRGGVISGKVTDEDNGSNVPNCKVNCYESASGELKAHVASDMLFATYELGPLHTGTYKVEFVPGYEPGIPADRTHLPEWYDDKACMEEADIITVPESEEVGGIDASLARGARISGRVTEDGSLRGVSGSPVRFYDAGTGAWLNTAYTDLFGNYTRGGFPTGEYLVEFAHNGVHHPEWYNDKPDGEQPDVVSVEAPAETININADLASMGSVSGRVTDMGTVPVSDCTASAYDAGTELCKGSARTDGDGQYAITGLPQGVYLVKFAPTDGVHLPEWYDDKPDMEHANSVEVADGQSVGDINALLEKECTISGTVTSSINGEPFEGCYVNYYDATGLWKGSVQTGDDGQYAITGLPRGEYLLEFAPADGVHVTEWYDDKPDMEHADSVEVADGQSVDGVNASLEKESTISGTVTSSINGEPFEGCPVRCYDAAGREKGSVQTGDDGRYTITGLPRGEYLLEFAPNDEVHLPEWYDDKPDMEHADSIEVADGQSVDGVNASLEKERGSIEFCAPESGRRGRTLDVIVKGKDTHFEEHVSEAVFSGEGITVNSVEVTSPVRATANITIGELAPLGEGDVNMVTGEEKPNPLAGGFTIIRGDPFIDSILPATGPIGTVVTIEGGSFHDSRNSSRVEFNGTEVTDYRSWSDERIEVVVPEGAGKGPVTVVAGMGRSNGWYFEVTEPPPDIELPRSTWYLAEGTTDWGFETYVTIANPNSEDVTAEITYMTDAGAVDGGTVNLPAASQATLNPGSTLGEADFSTTVKCREGKSIAVDRTMTWTGQGAPSPDGHCSIGVTSPSETWYLPEGSSDWGFECWLLIGNPNGAEATAQVTYMIEGADPVTVEKKIPANSRKTYNMAVDIGAADASIKVDADIPVIPERAMYRNNKREGHVSIGTTSPSQDYYLAEGTTNHGFTSYILIQNPNEEEARVSVIHLTPLGPVAPEPFTIPPNSRHTIRMNDALPGTDMSTHVQADRPIIAERAMYWDNGTGEACHDSIGMSEPHTTFYLPDGQTSEGRETYTLVMNPNSTEVTVEISYLTPDGKGNVTFTETIGSNSRSTFSMADEGITGRAAIMVTCKTPDKKIMAERAMYWNNRGAGTDTIGGYPGLSCLPVGE